MPRPRTIQECAPFAEIDMLEAMLGLVAGAVLQDADRSSAQKNPLAPAQRLKAARVRLIARPGLVLRLEAEGVYDRGPSTVVRHDRFQNVGARLQSTAEIVAFCGQSRPSRIGLGRALAHADIDALSAANAARMGLRAKDRPPTGSIQGPEMTLPMSAHERASALRALVQCVDAC